MIVITYRIRTKIIQYQIDDYLTGIKREIYKMWVPKDYRLARKRFWWLYIHHGTAKKMQLTCPSPEQTRIDDYIIQSIALTLPEKKYFCRFRSIPSVTYSDYAGEIISEREWSVIHSLPKFTGFFNNLFEFVDFHYFDEIQETLESNGVDFNGVFIYDTIAYELLRRLLGFQDFTGIEKMASFLRYNPLLGVLHDPFYFPFAAEVSYVLNNIPAEKLMDFYHDLVRQAIDLGIIYVRVAVLDGQFVRSNCNNNKNPDTNHYTDPDAGYYRHTGKKLGVGYVVWSVYAYCGTWDRTIPVHFKLFPGNKNDKPAFRETLQELYDLNYGDWKMVLCDTGAYCQTNLDFCVSNGSVPLIRARKGLKTHPTKELKKGYWFNTRYFPAGWSDHDVMEMYAERPIIEAGQSANPTFYNQKRLNTRGEDMAIKNRVLTCILDVSRAITAAKIGRTDLLTKLNSFLSAREFVTSFSFQKLARDSNYLQLMEPFLTPRQKEFWDNRRQKSTERGKKTKRINF